MSTTSRAGVERAPASKGSGSLAFRPSGVAVDDEVDGRPGRARRGGASRRGPCMPRRRAATAALRSARHRTATAWPRRVRPARRRSPRPPPPAPTTSTRRPRGSNAEVVAAPLTKPMPSNSAPSSVPSALRRTALTACAIVAEAVAAVEQRQHRRLVRDRQPQPVDVAGGAAPGARSREVARRHMRRHQHRIDAMAREQVVEESRARAPGRPGRRGSGRRVCVPLMCMAARMGSGAMVEARQAFATRLHER